MKIRPVYFALTITTLAVLQLGASCASTGGSDRDPTDNNGNSGSYDRPNRIPRSADRVRNGSGKLKWTADLDGSIYVYDADKEIILYSGAIRRGQEIVVVPGDDKIYIAERVVYQDNIRRESNHEIYFARERNQNDTGYGTGSGDSFPRDARRMARGAGNIAIDEAPRRGDVYVVDEQSGEVLFRMVVERGASVQIFPIKGYVNVNSKKAATVRFRDGRAYALYFREK